MSASIFADETIALITKSRGKVKYKISSESKLISNLQVNSPLFHGYGIKTKANSFARIVYLDDRSTISIYSKTELTINGIIEDRIISKQIDLTYGIIRLKIFNQITNEFMLTTPHSALTCNECDVWVISDKKTGDRIHNISGNVLVTNPSMIKTIELVNDSTIISLKDAEMEIYHTPITESKYMELLMFDVDEMPVKSDAELVIESKIADQSPETTSNVLKIRLKNALNIERTIILTYTK